MRSNKRVDFQALRQRVPIEQVCDLLGIQLKKTGEQLRGSCPICNHDSTRCFVVTPKLQRFWCFGDCQSGGDCIELVARVKQLSHKDAARFGKRKQGRQRSNKSIIPLFVDNAPGRAVATL